MSSIQEHDSCPESRGFCLRRSIVSPVQFLGFWTAVVSPFVLVGLVAVAAAGLASGARPALVAVLVTNIVGLLLGRGYNR